MPKHKVTIELEFESVPENLSVLDIDVYDYLEQLMEDQSLDYTVETSDGDTYGVINYITYLDRGHHTRSNNVTTKKDG